MKWTTEAEGALKKVPFFVRKKVRARVQEEALQNGKRRVTLAEVEATRKRYLTGMQSEIKGYQLESCFGPSGCPNAIPTDSDLADRIEELLVQANFLGFLESMGIKDIKFHHEFRVTLADCPNACSQPQIKDIGIIGTRRPALSQVACTSCEACVESCREGAITIDGSDPTPLVDMRRCVACGHCIPVCPGGTLTVGAEGYRVQLGGKLGRHPRLARELPGIYDADTILEIVAASIDIYKAGSRRGERFGDVLGSEDMERLAARFGPRAL